MSNDATPSKAIRWKRAGALLFGLALIAAACGSDEEPTAAEGADADASGQTADGEDAMEDDDAMEDEDAMAEEGRQILNLSFQGLEPLGDDFDYEIWSIVDEAPVTGGTFDIDDAGEIEIVDGGHLYGEEGATAIVVTIEPAVGDDPAPADTHVLAADVTEDGTFELTIDHPAAIGTDFADAAGSFVLATPTNDPDGDELAGVWFLSVPGPETSLELPTLPAGWVYEGWAVIDGTPVSTGRFVDPGAADDFDGFSGPVDGPNYPGEDFLTNAPDGLTFPVDLTSQTIVVSVEPDADNSPAPFALKPLVGDVPAGTGDHENVELGTGSVAISGSGSLGG